MIELIKAIFNQFRKHNYPLIFIRPKPISEPEIYEGDFDLLIHPDHIEKFFSVVHYQCSSAQYSFYIKNHRLDKLELVLFALDGTKTVHMDIWTELDIKSPHVKKGSAIPVQVLLDKGLIETNHPENDKLSAEIAALFYLSHLYSKKKNLNSSNVQNRLSYYCQLPGLSCELKAWLEQPNHTNMLAANDKLQQLGLIHYSTAHRLTKSWYRLKQDFRKKRKFIAIVGPDGVGKTTVIDALSVSLSGKYYRFKKMFRKGLLYSVLSSLTRKKLNQQTGFNLAKNQYDDLQYRKLFWIALLGGYLRGLSLNIGKLKLIDRYYPDLLVCGTRFEDKEVIRHPKAVNMIRLCPTPLAYIQLDAPYQVILERKAELTEQAINHLRDDYFEIGRQLNSPLYIYINNSHSLEATKKLLENIKI